MTTPESVHIVSHTHWDREWYLPQEQMRIRLVDLIDHLVELLQEDPDFAHFHLDGQTIVLDDYAAVRGEKIATLRRFIEEGRVLVGPWYEQNDLFLTSGESTVRNLIEGIRAAREVGGEMRVGYLPDHFGITSQMPQIFRLVGIDNCVFGRGFDVRTHRFSRFRWRGPDGSTVLAVIMTFWYNNAQRFPAIAKRTLELFRRIIENERLVNPHGPYLLMNGVDHLEAQEDLSRILKNLRSDIKGEFDIKHSTLPKFIADLRSGIPEETLPLVEGELREGGDHFILNGTLSSRVYLKLANDRCADLIEKWVEPLSAWCAAEGWEPVDRDYIRFLWKLYMENHPHDSICGCSQDSVHQQMMDRYRRVQQIAEEIIDRKLTAIGKRLDVSSVDARDINLIVANMSNIDVGVLYSEEKDSPPVFTTARTSVYFLSEDKVEDFALIATGTGLPYLVHNVEETRTMVLSPINLPGVLRVTRYDIEFPVRTPAFGFSAYRVTPRGVGRRLKPRPLDDHLLENDHLRVSVRPDGRLDILDKESGRVYHGAGSFFDVVDRGNLYTSIPAGRERTWSGPVEFTEAIACEAFQRLSYRFSWEVPADLAAADLQTSQDAASDPREGVQENAPTGPGLVAVEVTLRLDAKARALDVRIDVDNQAKDHRLRFAVPIDGCTRTLAGGQFDIVERALDYGRQWQRSSNGQPFSRWVAACGETDAADTSTNDDSKSDCGGAAGDACRGIAIFAEGLHDYEVADDDSTLAVTLLRGAETINDREEPPLETDIQPEGQCIGKYSFHLALRPLAGTDPVRLAREAEFFCVGLRFKQWPVYDDRWFQGRSFVQDSQAEGAFQRFDPNVREAETGPLSTFIELSGDPVLVSATKWHEREECLVLRVHNPSDRRVSSTVRLPKRITGAEIVNLLEEPIPDRRPTEVGERSVTVDVGPREILTVACRFRS